MSSSISHLAQILCFCPMAICSQEGFRRLAHGEVVMLPSALELGVWRGKESDIVDSWSLLWEVGLEMVKRCEGILGSFGEGWS